MTTITPAATLALKDTTLSPNPNPVTFAGQPVDCPVGAMIQDVTLPASTSEEAIPYPFGVTTAAILAICPVTITDLIVTLNAEDLSVPLGQPLFLYGVAAADVSVSSVLGGKVTFAVGG
jgi:hypothetical protein